MQIAFFRMFANLQLSVGIHGHHKFLYGREPILHLPRPRMLFVFCLRLKAKISKGFVHIVIAERGPFVDPNICCYPAISMRRMFRMDLRHQCNDKLPFVLICRFTAFLPFIVSCAADSHQITQLFDVIFPGQQIYDPEFFGLKGI